MRVSLELEGYAVREAGNAEEGLAALEAEAQPQLILLDVMMPGTDGWEMLQRIQERHGADPRRHVQRPGRRESAERAAERGASAFVGKPFDPQQLIDRAKQILPSRTARAAGTVIDLDQRLERWIVGHRAEPFDTFFVALSHIGSFGLVWFVLAVVAAFVLRRPVVLPMVVIAYFSTAAITDLIKLAVDRQRPIDHPLVPEPTTSSFPSGHAATSFACAATLAPTFRGAARSCSTCSLRRSPTRACTSASTTRSTCSPEPRSACSSLELFGRFQQPCNDHGERREQADPDSDAATVGRKKLLRDLDDADEDEDGRERAEPDHHEALGHRRRQLDSRPGAGRRAPAPRAR